jgi:hypothetical protein
MEIRTLGLDQPDSHDDPEACFRRGYQQGAYDAVSAIQTTPIEKVLEWVNVTLTRWRYQDSPHDRGRRPPRIA